MTGMRTKRSLPRRLEGHGQLAPAAFRWPVNRCLRATVPSVLTFMGFEGRHAGNAEDRGDPGCGHRRLQPARRRGRGSTLSRLRGLRSDLIDPAIAVHNGRVFKRTGDGSLVEFRSVVDAVRCAIEEQNGLIERNSGLPPDRRIEFRVGIHLGGRGERRRFDGRRRQYRRAPRRHLRGGRDLPLRGRLLQLRGAVDADLALQSVEGRLAPGFGDNMFRVDTATRWIDGENPDTRQLARRSSRCASEAGA